MPVMQFVEHCCAYIEKRKCCFCCIGLRMIAVVDLVPVNAIVFEEAIMLIDKAPQTIEIIRTGILIVRYIVASGQEDDKDRKNSKKAFHGCMFNKVDN